MPNSYRSYQPEQAFLLPPSPRDWLPDNHLALFISDVVDEMDLAAFEAKYQEGDPRGNQPFHPAMMVKVLVYAYATGTFSSRKIAMKIEEDVAYRYLAAGNFPQHRTICDFRKDHLSGFIKLFGQVVQIAKASGLVKLGRVAIDGTKVRANASRHKSMSYGRMEQEEQRLKKEIAALVKEAERADRREDKELGADKRGDELPEELRRRETRLEKIREAKKKLEDRQAEADREDGRREDDQRRPTGKGRPRKRDFGVPEAKAQENFTDSESRIMKVGNGFDQCYNAQTAVDETSQVIVAADVTNCAVDRGQLVPMIEATIETVGAKPECVLADAGYRSEENFLCVEKLGVEAMVALGKEYKEDKSVIAANKRATKRMREKLETPEGKQAYSRRKAIVEAPFGWIKNVLGFRQFSFRGLEKVKAEWALVCLAVNLRRMSTMACVI